ncbi:hypothetical protein DIPPA_04293 [Diplonema papillatum]|nr:hypothetical protein DIPPA_04293 [Diplonema papillatum]
MPAQVYVGGVPADWGKDEVLKAVSEQVKGVTDVVMGEKGVAFVNVETDAEARRAADEGISLAGTPATVHVVQSQAAAAAAPAAAKRGAAPADRAPKRRRKGGPPRDDARAAGQRFRKRQPPAAPADPNASRILLVANFGDAVSVPQLAELFEAHGEVEKVELHPVGSAKPAFALVYMQYPYCAERARAEINGNLFCGRTLTVDYSYEDVPVAPAGDTPRVTLALDPGAPGNHRITIGQLLLMLAPIADDTSKDLGAFVDRHGHIIIPVTGFMNDDDDSEAAADDDAGTDE